MEYMVYIFFFIEKYVQSNRIIIILLELSI